MRGMIYIWLAVSLILPGCAPASDLPEAIPQERSSWPNPGGYGLEPETGAYTGLFY